MSDMPGGIAQGREPAAGELEDFKARWGQLRNGDCGYGVVPEEWHHGVAGPPMTDTPADRCER